MTRRTVILDSPSRIKQAHAFVDRAAAAGGYVVEFKKATRTLEQNARMWAMIADIYRAHPTWNGMPMSLDRWKATFMDALGVEQDYAPSLEGGGIVPIGQRSSNLTKSQMSDLIELMLAFGAKHDVKWSDPKQTGKQHEKRID